MRSNPLLIFFVFSAIIFIIDFTAYKGLIKLGYKWTTKFIFKLIYWTIPLLIILSIIILSLARSSFSPMFYFFYVHLISGFFFLVYLPKLVFILFHTMQAVYNFVIFLIKKINKSIVHNPNSKLITRSQFLRKTGLLAAGIPFISVVYGIAWGRFDYKVRRIKLAFNNLPGKFNGFKIVQISDLHIGSFVHHENQVEKAVELINEQEPDLILFTGDFVNNVSSESEGFINILRNLRARYGIYSILGNHDYGDYYRWRNELEKKNNFQQLLDIQNSIGFNVILNDSTMLFIDDDYIELIGVENWGLPPFPQYGDLAKAVSNTDENSFKILMSHDPTHWDEEVLHKTNIELTLSGHTHGAQFGIEVPGWRWSPVNMRYKRWGGLYEEGYQKLYVNTGIGFIGFPGRIGMPPEITVIELNSELNS